MDDLFGILVFLFILYAVGWFVSLFVLLIGSTTARFQIATAHAYAILLLLIAAQITRNEFGAIFYILCIFDFLAIVLFLFLYVRGVKKKTNDSVVKEIHRFINTKENI
jgi:hypothetical protein